MKVGWGIDVGVGSLGFAVIELDAEDRPARLIDGVARVYPVPTGGAERTRHRSMRTQNQRHARRIKILRGELIRLFDLASRFDDEHAHPDLTDGVKPDGQPRRNTSRVRLRAHGLSGPLSAGDLARAILHIAKNRGQRLTRGLKDETKGDAEQQKKAARDRQSMADTAKTTKNELAALGARLKLSGAAHPSQLLMDKAGKTESTRLKKNREGIPVFTRGMVEAELDALLKTQQNHHEALTDEVCENLVAKVFWEAEPEKQSIGKCRYGVRHATGDIEIRLPRGSDLFQRKRIYEEVNNLRLVSQRGRPDEPLTGEQRNHLAALLLDGKDLSAAKVKSELGLGRGALDDMTSLDISRKGRKTAGKLRGHPLAAAMQKAGALEEWRHFDDAMRERIAELVRTEDDVDVLHDQLRGLGLEAGVIQALSDARLPATYSAAGRTATSKLLAELEACVISNHDAEKRAGLKPLDPQPPRLDRLPYYGEILQGWCVGGDGDPASRNEARLGRIPNPVVHVALNQLRKTANAYLRLYGKPTRICVELARDLNKSAADREEAEMEADRNRKANEKYIETLGAHKRRLTPEHLKRLRLHRMQDGVCLYTGRSISMEQVLEDGLLQIDHILPRADTGDDGMSNLALVFQDANQYKRKRSPFEAFGAGYLDYDYEHILARARKRGGGVQGRRDGALQEPRSIQKPIPQRYPIHRANGGALSIMCL